MSGATTETPAKAAEPALPLASYAGLGILAFGLLFITMMIQSESRKVTATLTPNALSIRAGSHSTSVPRAGIINVKLIRKLSGIGGRRNAFQFGNAYHGAFSMREYGSALLYLDATKPPFIVVTSTTGTVLFGLDDSVSTKAMFEALSSLRQSTGSR